MRHNLLFKYYLSVKKTRPVQLFFGNSMPPLYHIKFGIFRENSELLLVPAFPLGRLSKTEPQTIRGFPLPDIPGFFQLKSGRFSYGAADLIIITDTYFSSHSRRIFQHSYCLVRVGKKTPSAPSLSN